MPEEKTPPEQIPWAKETKVTHFSDTSASFEKVWRNGRGNENITGAEVFFRDFEWSVSIDSRAEIRNYMMRDERLTRDLLDFWDEDREKHPTSTFRDRIIRWLRGQGGRAHRVGPKEWRPVKVRGPVGKLTDSYGYGNTYNEDPSYWWGDEVFEFAHFNTVDEEEAAVIIWNTSGGPMGNYAEPEVWTGNFEEFMDIQHEGDPWSYETFQRWNRNFENAFIWAWHRMGVFEDWDGHIVDHDDRRVRGVLQAIERDPAILIPESVEQIVTNGVETYPKEIQKAVRWLVTNHRRELEKALGQKLLWKEEDLYGG